MLCVKICLCNSFSFWKFLIHNCCIDDVLDELSDTSYWLSTRFSSPTVRCKSMPWVLHLKTSPSFFTPSLPPLIWDLEQRRLVFAFNAKSQLSAWIASLANTLSIFLTSYNPTLRPSSYNLHLTSVPSSPLVWTQNYVVKDHFLVPDRPDIIFGGWLGLKQQPAN